MLNLTWRSKSKCCSFLHPTSNHQTYSIFLFLSIFVFFSLSFFFYFSLFVGFSVFRQTYHIKYYTPTGPTTHSHLTTSNHQKSPHRCHMAATSIMKIIRKFFIWSEINNQYVKPPSHQMCSRSSDVAVHRLFFHCNDAFFIFSSTWGHLISSDLIILWHRHGGTVAMGLCGYEMRVSKLIESKTKKTQSYFIDVPKWHLTKNDFRWRLAGR